MSCLRDLLLRMVFPLISRVSTGALILDIHVFLRWLPGSVCILHAVNKNMRPSLLTAIRIGHNRWFYAHALDNGPYIAHLLQLALKSHGSR